MGSTAMYTAVTGTDAQQSRIDVIAHNLANLATRGFKRMRPDFEDLLYETVQAPLEQGGSPTGLQYGRGARAVGTEHVHTQGTLLTTDQPFDMAIEGSGFFTVVQLNGDLAYTRNGSFKLDADGLLVNAQGLELSPAITIPNDAIDVNITSDGRVEVTTPGNPTPSEVGQIQLTRFPNPGGLEAIGHNLYRETGSSGSPITGDPGEDAFGQISQGALEESNVNIAEELVNMILAQRAFEANTRVIETADEMLRFVTQR